MFKVWEDQHCRDRNFRGAQWEGGAGAERHLGDGRIETRFQSGVQFGVFAPSRVLVRVVVGTILMTPSVLLVRRFERKVSVPIDADDNAPIQAEATAGQDGEADEKAGSDTKRHKIQEDDGKARELTGQKE